MYKPWAVELSILNLDFDTHRFTKPTNRSNSINVTRTTYFADGVKILIIWEDVRLGFSGDNEAYLSALIPEP